MRAPREAWGASRRAAEPQSFEMDSCVLDSVRDTEDAVLEQAGAEVEE